uniref:GST N-terminal domain-containing protein n=1 Tax=Heligmosomoides polygyrus TaxID=6339 RepID=A0A183GD40_HELPZ
LTRNTRIRSPTSTFNRGEPIRLIFAYFDVQCEDNRITQEDWPKFKPDSPMGQAPYLVVDDGKLALCQMQAICRYLAKSLRPNDYFAGATKSDSARCDMYVEAFMDLYTLGVERAFEKDPEMKAKKDEKFKSQRPVRLELLQDHLKKNGGQCFVGRKASSCKPMYFASIPRQ